MQAADRLRQRGSENRIAEPTPIVGRDAILSALSRWDCGESESCREILVYESSSSQRTIR